MPHSRVRLCAAMLLAGTALASPAHAQTREPLENRVDRLEALLNKVIERMDRLGATLTPGEAQTVRDAQGVVAQGVVSGAASNAAGTGAASTAVVAQDQRGNAEAAAGPPSVASRIEALEKSQGLGFRVGGSTIRIGGYFKTDVVASKYSDGDPPPGTFIRNYYSPGGIPVANTAAAGRIAREGVQTTFSSRETRFSINTETPVGDKKLLGVLELDFFDTPLIGNERVSSSFVPRIRQAYLTYDKFTIGETWTTFQNVATLPERVDFIGPTEGTVFQRHVLLRYTDGDFQIALENPETTVQQGVTSLEADDDRVPDVVVRYNAKGDWGSAAIAAIGRYLSYDAGIANGVDDSAIGYGVSVSGVIKVGSTDNFNFMVTGGEGIGRYVGLNIRDDVIVDANRRLDTVGVIAGFASYRHFWNPQIRSVLTGSYYQAYNPALAGLLVTDNVGSVSFDTFYSPLKPLTLGLGYRYARRELVNDQAGDLNRLQFSAQYNF